MGLDQTGAKAALIRLEEHLRTWAMPSSLATAAPPRDAAPLRLLAPPPGTDLWQLMIDISRKLAHQIGPSFFASQFHSGEREQARAPFERAVHNLIGRSQLVHKPARCGFGRRYEKSAHC